MGTPTNDATRPRPSEDRLLSPKAVALRLGQSKRTIYRWMRKGIIPFVLVGPSKRRRVREVDVTAQIHERASASAGQTVTS